MKYFSTPKIKKIELRFSALLLRELKFLPQKINTEQVKELQPHIKKFTAECHKLFSEYTAEVLKQHKSPVSCKGKCSNCCHHYPMSIEPFELISLYSLLRESQNFPLIVEALWHRASTFSKLLNEKTENDALKKYFSLSLPCPFLASNGDCGIYEHRPITCRMYFSITGPRFCIPAYLQSPKNKNFIVYLPDKLENLLADISERYLEIELSEALYGGLLEMNGLEEVFGCIISSS